MLQLTDKYHILKLQVIHNKNFEKMFCFPFSSIIFIYLKILHTMKKSYTLNICITSKDLLNIAEINTRYSKDT